MALLALLLATTWAVPAAGTPLPPAAVQAVPFVPFQMEELIDSRTGQPAMPGSIFEVVVDGRTAYRGTPERLLEILNGIERQQTALGRSLRSDGPLWTAASTDPAVLHLQLLHDLGIGGDAALAQVRPPLRDCPHLELSALRPVSPTDGCPTPQTMMRVEGDTYLSAADVVERMNAQQDLLCSLGWDMLLGVGAPHATTVADLMSRRREAMAAFGISAYHQTFAMLPLTPLRSLAEIAAEAEAATAARRVPTVLDLRRLRGEMPTLPAYQVPDLPVVQVVEPPAPRPLVVHKYRPWDGLHLGDRGKFAAEADGFYKIDASEASARAEAVGRASVYIANNTINILDARAVAHGTDRAVCASAYLNVMGQTVAEESRADTAEVHLHAADLLTFEFEKGFRQQLMVGPVPVEFVEGAKVTLSIGVGMSVVGTGLDASLLPKAVARAFASGAVGVEALGLGVGVGCGLTVLDLTAPLQGKSTFVLDHGAEPALLSHIDVGLDYGALQGSLYVFAQIPWPRAGLPPWRLKRVEHNVFSWGGFAGRHRLVGWGQRLSSTGVRLLGDLNDASDLDQAATLQAAIEAERRQRQLVLMENAMAEHEATVFAAISADTGGESAFRVFRDVQLVIREGEEVAALSAPYLENLTTLLHSLRADADP